MMTVGTPPSGPPPPRVSAATDELSSAMDGSYWGVVDTERGLCVCRDAARPGLRNPAVRGLTTSPGLRATLGHVLVTQCVLYCMTKVTPLSVQHVSVGASW